MTTEIRDFLDGMFTGKEVQRLGLLDCLGLLMDWWQDGVETPDALTMVDICEYLEELSQKK